jgi:hypothetical protein
MNMPGFTAEASLGKTRDSYVFTSGVPTETGSVLPQCELIWDTSQGGWHWIGCDFDVR